MKMELASLVVLGVALSAATAAGGCAGALEPPPADGGASGADTTGAAGNGKAQGLADGGATGCAPPCATGETCVQSQFEGGPLIVPDDAGSCPSGRHATNGQCVPDPTFACAATPAACNGSVDCSCASSLCRDSYTCVGASGTELSCLEAVP